MFKVQIKQSIIDHCRKQIQKYNFGKRHSGNGSKSEQYVGIVGQSVVSDMFNQPLIDGSTGSDGGEDLNYHNLIIDVKTMIRTTDVKSDYVSNFVAFQKEFNTDVYIFTSCNKIKKEITIVGWIDKQSLLLKSELFKKGSLRHRSNNTSFKLRNDMYEIQNNKLYEVDNIEQLKRQLILYRGD